MNRYLRSLVCLLLQLSFLIIAQNYCKAAVAIVANNTDGPVQFSVINPDGKQQKYSIERTDVIPIPVADKLGIEYLADGKPHRYLLQANTIECFVSTDNTLELRTISLPAAPDENKNLPPPKARNIDHGIFTIAVKILVDDDQPAIQKIWEKELRERIADASAIFEHHCGVRFEVKAVDTWQSDNEITDFEKSLQEFERKVNPSPAQVAIGFTSQYSIPKGLIHLGGTRGPLYPYILIREWSQHVTKSERLEILVHEMGHFLGASHTADIDSVMRPQLGDRRSHSTNFRIGFDPLNTLAMNLVADELRSGEYRIFPLMPSDTKRILKRIYFALGKDIPKDPAASHYIEMLNIPLTATNIQPKKPSGMVAYTKTVVSAVEEAARINNKAIAELKGDMMTELLIRRAAADAAKNPPAFAPQAFLLGIGIALDDSKLLRETPLLGDFVREIEPDDARDRRIAVLGKTTILGRQDLAQHFVVSCALTARFGPSLAEKAGLAKEVSDAQGGSGFSFKDLAADMAGVAFASQVRNGKLKLEKLANSFKISDFMPKSDDLKENISWDEFTKEYGSLSDDRFLQVRNLIQRRIQSLPEYQ